MSAHKYRLSKDYARDAAGDVAASAKLFFYTTGTTTPLTVYSDAGLSSAHANPVEADSAGLFTNIFLGNGGPYRAILKNAAETVTYFDEDPVYRDRVRIQASALPSVNWPGLLVDLSSDGHTWERNSSDTGWTDLGPTDSAPSAGGRQTIWIPANAMDIRITNGPSPGEVETTTNKVMIKTLDFDKDTIEYAQFSVQMPTGWDEGTLSAVFVWSHPSTTTNFGVVWALQGFCFSNDDALDQAFGTAQTSTDTGGTTDDLYRSPETPAITLGGTAAEDDVAIFQVYRNATDGSDTLAVDARLHGVALFYTTNALTDD